MNESPSPKPDGAAAIGFPRCRTSARGHPRCAVASRRIRGLHARRVSITPVRACGTAFPNRRLHLGTVHPYTEHRFKSRLVMSSSRLIRQSLDCLNSTDRHSQPKPNIVMLFTSSTLNVVVESGFWKIVLTSSEHLANEEFGLSSTCGEPVEMCSRVDPKATVERGQRRAQSAKSPTHRGPRARGNRRGESSLIQGDFETSSCILLMGFLIDDA